MSGDGSVIVSDLTLENDTDAPTVVVYDGNLTLRNVVVEESTAADQSALLVTGGTVTWAPRTTPAATRSRPGARAR